MRKVMIVIDEIQQKNGLESFLRRLGFDVLSLSKDALVSDALLSFQPEIVIASQSGRHVDGVKLSKRLKKTVSPAPRVAICYSGVQPQLSAEDQKSIDALMEIPAGENAIRLLAQLASLKAEPLLEKYRKFSSAQLSRDEDLVLVQGPHAASSQKKVSSTAGGGAQDAGREWDPVKAPGTSATARSERSSRYDDFLSNHASDLDKDVTKKVLPRERAAQLMKKLKEDSKKDQDLLDEIQKQKLKFAETLFTEKKKK